MADILIRNVPEDVLATIDANAARIGLSRSAYIRRALAREHAVIAEHVSVADLLRLATLAADLDDPSVMSQAWS